MAERSFALRTAAYTAALEGLMDELGPRVGNGRISLRGDTGRSLIASLELAHGRVSLKCGYGVTLTYRGPARNRFTPGVHVTDTVARWGDHRALAGALLRVHSHGLLAERVIAGFRAWAELDRLWLEGQAPQTADDAADILRGPAGVRVMYGNDGIHDVSGFHGRPASNGVLTRTVMLKMDGMTEAVAEVEGEEVTVRMGGHHLDRRAITYHADDARSAYEDLRSRGRMMMVEFEGGEVTIRTVDPPAG